MSESHEEAGPRRSRRAKVLREELERAEQRGEDRIRQRVLAIPDSKRYMHSISHATFEVIDAAAVEEAIRVAEP